MTTTESAQSAADTLSIRREVLDFVLASEALLSTFFGPSELTEEERGLIVEYVTSLSSSGKSWSKALPVRYNI